MMLMIESWIIPSSLVIAAVLAIRFALRGKISLRLQYALWAVVLVRLLLPFQVFISPLSVDTVAEELDIPGAMQQVYLSANEDAYERQYDATYHEAVRWHESKGKPFDPAQVEQQAAETARQSLDLSLNLKLFNLWLTGMAAMALVIVSCNLHFALRLRRSRRDFPVPDCLLRVYVTNAVPTPCIFGLFRPAIYLTPGAAEDETVLRHALTHELTHYRHLDHVWSVLRSVCLVLHWYNPLVWIAAKVSRADGELACDEGALRVLGESQRGDYGRTLIGLTCGVRLGSLFVTATTMTGSAGSLRERIRLLMKRPKTTMLTLTALILVVTVIVGCTFSAAPATEQPGIDLEGMGEKIQNGIQNGDVILDFPDTTEPTGHVPDNDMAYEGQELPIPETPGDPTAQITALFSAEGDPIFRGALTRLYDVAVMEEIEFLPEELFIPEITQIDMTHDSDALVYYRKPGDHRLYVASVCDNSIWSNKLVVRMEDYAHLNPRELTEEELQQFRCVFGTLNLDGEINPAACFLISHYEDITELRRRDFMAYFPIAEDGSREEFELLKGKYPEFFGDWTWETMPIPIHRYDPAALTSVLQTYGGIRWVDLSDDGTHYLEETGCYYNYTSDFGLGGFRANSGFVYDGGAVICGDWSALFFTETQGHYTIQAHLPAITTEG